MTSEHIEHPKQYGVVVLGGGHAGIEAAMASARLGAATALLTQNLDTIGQMSCNPAIGGLAKGHMVREIDALGGFMGINTDATGIQFRMLNAKKGPSVRAPRAQADKKAYQFRAKWVVELSPNLDLHQGGAAEILTKAGRVTGVRTALGLVFHTKAVILSAGTFMRGLMHVGKQNQSGGRMGDSISTISDSLRALGFETERFKTGTPCRLNARSVDFSKCTRQDGDAGAPAFSYMRHTIDDGVDCPFSPNAWSKNTFHVEQTPCWVTYTNPKTHAIIAENIDRSPMYSGQIEGVGPRYCPSIEDKVMRFADKERHQIFLEPEGRQTSELYVNGVSTSLPFDVQYDFIRSIDGLENAEIIRPGYAVEYDYCPPTQLRPTLETKEVEGLYFAGQVNGTSGYEEAAAQGLYAGANAALKLDGKPPLHLSRDEAYIGVMIDDLVTKGAAEPYRMFTSRAEYRLLLRQDNADLRLTAKADELGLVSEERSSHTQAKADQVEAAHKQLSSTSHDGTPIPKWLRRPESQIVDLPESIVGRYSAEVLSIVETDLKYQGYIGRQHEQVQKAKRMEDRLLPATADYSLVKGLKREAEQKLTEIRPETLGQASRVQGITPADISVLTVWLERNGASQADDDRK